MHIDTRCRHGHEIRFVVRSEGTGYVRALWDARDAQPCAGGGWLGSTLMTTAERLAHVVRRWLRAARRAAAVSGACWHPGCDR